MSRAATLVRLMVAGLMLALLSGCFGSGNRSDSRYSIRQDRGPDSQVDLSSVPDAVPRAEPRSRGGNKSPYRVWGKQYYVMSTASGYSKEGIASWYGKKFHGHKTSNGEIYDMYGMSAAHKALPLPTYVRVTNLANQRSVVVRVNDRGPFHGSRLIDLSYAAAYRLDMLKKGTARVRVEAIVPGDKPVTELVRQSSAPAPVPQVPVTATIPVARQYVQVGAYSSWAAAQTVKTRLEALVSDLSVLIRKREGTKVLYRVQMGPVLSAAALDELLPVLRSAGFPDPRVVDLP